MRCCLWKRDWAQTQLLYRTTPRFQIGLCVCDTAWQESQRFPERSERCTESLTAWGTFFLFWFLFFNTSLDRSSVITASPCWKMTEVNLFLSSGSAKSTGASVAPYRPGLLGMQRDKAFLSCLAGEELPGELITTMFVHLTCLITSLNHFQPRFTS